MLTDIFSQLPTNKQQGCKLMTTLVHELERRGARYGLQAICEGGGTANATIIERVVNYTPPANL